VSGYGRGAGTVGSVARSTARPMKKIGVARLGRWQGFNTKRFWEKEKLFYFQNLL
jgi:hypothetical protein